MFPKAYFALYFKVFTVLHQKHILGINILMVFIVWTTILVIIQCQF